MQYTRGLQEGEDERYVQVVVTLKHWDAYSLENSDGFTRHNFNAIVSNQTVSTANGINGDCRDTVVMAALFPGFNADVPSF